MNKVAASNIGITVLRIVVGIVFFMHGWQKVFQYTFGGTIGAFTQMGVPLPTLVAPGVALLELLGGLALIVGLGTRFVAPLLAVNMLAAALIVHLPNGFFAPGGVEFVLTLFAASLALTLTGAGAFALDNLLEQRNTRTESQALAS